MTPIPDEAVEAACQAHIPLFWENLDERMQVEGRKQMRAALEAALPHLVPDKGEVGAEPVAELIAAAKQVYAKLYSPTGTVTILDQDRLGKALEALYLKPLPPERGSEDRVAWPEWATDAFISGEILKDAETILDLCIGENVADIPAIVGAIKVRAGTLQQRELHRHKYALASPPLSQPRAEVIGDIEVVTIPKPALDWLMGEGLDPGGLAFGDFPEDRPKPPGAFWWRKTFREIWLYYAPRMIKGALSSTSGATKPSDEYKEAMRYVEGGE